MSGIGECRELVNGHNSSIQLVAIVRCSGELVKVIYKVEWAGYSTAFVLSKNKGLAAVYQPRFLFGFFFSFE